MSEELFFVKPLQDILQDYINRHFHDHPTKVLRLPMTGAVRFDSWIENNEIVFRVFTETDQ